MRITQERQDSTIRITQAEVILGRAIVEVCEAHPEVTEAEIMAAMTNMIYRRALRTAHSETKPYEGYVEDDFVNDEEDEG